MLATQVSAKVTPCTCSRSSKAAAGRVPQRHVLSSSNAVARLPVAAFAPKVSGAKGRNSLCVFAADKTTTKVAGVVTDSTWDELVLKSPSLVLVDFWAPWCGPCRMIAPMVDEIAGELEGKLVALKLNTDESPAVATKYGIRSIPTVMLFKGGVKQDTVIGAVPKSTLLQTVEKYL